MKKLLVVLSMLAFMVPATIACAKDVGQAEQTEPKIKCCFQDGQCLETRRKNCEQKKGKVVSDCKSCPGVFGQGK
jgi:hypothetical protein